MMQGLRGSGPDHKLRTGVLFEMPLDMFHWGPTELQLEELYRDRGTVQD